MTLDDYDIRSSSEAVELIEYALGGRVCVTPCGECVQDSRCHIWHIHDAFEWMPEPVAAAFFLGGLTE